MRAGVAQITLHSEIGLNVDKTCSYIRSAACQGLDVLCFPECSLTGYMRDFQKIHWNEISKALDKLQQVVTDEDITVIIGTAWLEAGKIYNAAVVVSADNRLKYFKQNLTDFDKQYFAAGKDTLSFEIKGIRCGLIICRDQNYPALAKKYAVAGTSVIFLPSAHYYSPEQAYHKLDKNRALPIARAVENKVFVAKANAVGSQGDYVSLGHSLIVGPEGFVIDEAGEKEEKLLYHDI